MYAVTFMLSCLARTLAIGVEEMPVISLGSPDTVAAALHPFRHFRASGESGSGRWFAQSFVANLTWTKPASQRKAGVVHFGKNCRPPLAAPILCWKIGNR